MPSALASLHVLVLDGQSTAATPAHGHLLELGWARTRALDPDASLAIETHRLALPPGATIPRPVTRLTGITLADLDDAEPPAEVWAALLGALRCGGAPPRVVIHYARFELPFLRSLHAAWAGDAALPFEPLCTHEIARRLLPALPRRGLRALAGYLGLGVDALKRSAEHVRATAFVWRALVERLEHEHGVTTLAALDDWLRQPAPRRSTRRAYPMDRQRRLSLPDAPGVYRMLRSDGSVLYVGKATSLRRRVNGYFRQHRRVADRTLEMLTQARDLDVTVTATALEAALLESDEIKAHAPPYNVMLRPRAQGPWYASPDLRRLADHPEPGCPVGPMSSRALMEAWAALARTDDPAIAPEPPSLQSWWFEPPPAEIWAEGWTLFRRTWDPSPASRGPSGLARIGARIWQTWREHDDPRAKDDDPEPPAEPTEPTEPTEPAWDPPRVVAWLERLVAQGAHELRRAAWLRALSTSTVTWSRRDHGRRVLVLDRGAVVHRGDLEPGAPPPAPPPPRDPALDWAGFDRLRVLTTEIRRLVTEGREVHLWCSPRRRLEGERLARALAWI
ncbi:MAG: GIY-YIG nuclease family protein [Myxococcales bacterium]|nr:GIY-YIG nuclease family protein [Myxococcales bacterium]